MKIYRIGNMNNTPLYKTIRIATILINPLIQKICKVKAIKINRAISEYVEGKTLDVGAGRCYIAKEVQTKNKGVKVTCLDINDFNKTGLDLTLYDGKNMPFNDNSFDTLLLIYVLHHVDDPIYFLKECKRVCKSNGKIIIIEDTAESLLVKPVDFLYNHFHNVKTPFNFKTDIEWIILYNKLGLDIIGIKRGVEKEWFCPIEHIMFVLRKR